MSNESESLIAKAQEKIRSLEADIVKTKEFVNQLRVFEGESPLYTDLAAKTDGSIGSIRSDRFYGQPLATAVRDILIMRKAANLGAASVNVIYSTLVAGGYSFDTTNELNAKTGLRSALRKNPVFHKIPGNGEYGLSEWYPKRKRARLDDNGGPDDDESGEKMAEEPERLPVKAK